MSEERTLGMEIVESGQFEEQTLRTQIRVREKEFDTVYCYFYFYDYHINML